MNKCLKPGLFCRLAALYFVGVSFTASGQRTDLVSVKEGRFFLAQKEYRFVGVNYWPAAYLGMKAYPGDRNRLNKELDFLASKGVTNLRVLVSSEGDSTYPYRVSPSFQPAQGVFREAFLDGLDYLLQQCGRRKLKVVLYFTNQWEWSGGFGQYLEWNGFGKTPLPKTENWDWANYCTYMARFYTCNACTNQVNQLISKVLTRKNSLTGILYKNDPAIFSWELANEPRPMKKTANEAFYQWVNQTSQYVKKLDPNHLLTIGSEGDVAFGYDMDACKQVHQLPSVDYLTIHIWPKNWKWFPDTSISGNLTAIKEKSGQFVDRHLALAKSLDKPLVLEEFGLPRDAHRFEEGTSVSSRDHYYEWGLKLWKTTTSTRGGLSGVCFWAFGGMTPFPEKGEFWKQGEPLRGDPPQEEQGLNSIYASDSTTWQLIKKYAISP